MGETGCGKTRLIRYMCDLARQKKRITNMLILKVQPYLWYEIKSVFIYRYMEVLQKKILFPSLERHKKSVKQIGLLK